MLSCRRRLQAPCLDEDSDTVVVEHEQDHAAFGWQDLGCAAIGGDHDCMRRTGLHAVWPPAGDPGGRRCAMGRSGVERTCRVRVSHDGDLDPKLPDVRRDILLARGKSKRLGNVLGAACHRDEGPQARKFGSDHV